jgi:hypothetical protein
MYNNIISTTGRASVFVMPCFPLFGRGSSFFSHIIAAAILTLVDLRQMIALSLICDRRQLFCQFVTNDNFFLSLVFFFFFFSFFSFFN